MQNLHTKTGVQTFDDSSEPYIGNSALVGCICTVSSVITVCTQHRSKVTMPSARRRGRLCMA